MKTEQLQIQHQINRPRIDWEEINSILFMAFVFVAIAMMWKSNE